MKKKTGSFIIFLLKAVFYAVVLGIFAYGQRYFYSETLFYFWGNNIILLLYAAILYLTNRIYNGFDYGNAKLYELIVSWLLCFIIVNVFQYFVLSLLVSALLPVSGFILMLAAQILFAIPMSAIMNIVYYYYNPTRSTLIIYGDKQKLQIYQRMIDEQRNKFLITKVMPQFTQTGEILDAINSVESVFFLGVEEIKQDGLIEYCYLNDKHAYVLPSFTKILLNTANTIWLANSPVFSLKNPEPNIGTLLIKRLMDIIISLLVIILTSPVMIVVWLAVRLTDNHPAIYKQVRVTKGGRNFTIYKFRSMIPDAEDDGVPRLTSKDDNRITPIGRFIRSTRIDELPQMFNVLFGSMSLVGPRPERPEIAKQYEEIYPTFAFRTKVKAGITGIAQIYGRYNTAPEDKLFLDIMYIETFSILQDFKLILQTISVLLKPSSTEGIENDSTTALR